MIFITNIKQKTFKNFPRKKIGFVSFTDPRKEVKLAIEREQYIKDSHEEVVKNIQEAGFEVCNPQIKLKGEKIKDKNWGITNLSEISELLKLFQEEKIAGLIIGCFAWNEPDIPHKLAKELDIPVALITINNPKWPGITAITSTGASFWQLASNFYIKKHERFTLTTPSKIESLLPWINAVTSLKYLRTGKLLLWGGTPALNMEHLDDDTSTLKRILIDDIITQDQFVLVNLAEKILNENSNRIDEFISWLKNNQCEIIFDDKMLTQEVLEKQIALYLASKDIINDFHNQNELIIGTSIKCQPELSVHYGVTPCLIPAFLPFAIDSEGDKPIIPAVCEGDIKGLITSVLLYGLNPKIPPLFGDLKVLRDDHFIIANCGAASAFYANNNLEPSISLSKSSIAAQCQGASGGAFGYRTPQTKKEVTYARLIRIDDTYFLQYGLGKLKHVTEESEFGWGITWPHTAVSLKIPPELFIKAIGTNHLSLTIGNFEQELRYISKILNIPTIRVDNKASTQEFLEYY